MTASSSHSQQELAQRTKRLVPTRPGKRRIVVTLLVTITLLAAVLKLTPFQQTVIGNGKVGVFTVMDRPQTIDAQIGGRLVLWKVQEGQTVQKGQLLAEIEDTESRFLSQRRTALLDQQLAAQRLRKAEGERRIAEIEAQLGSLESSRGAQIPAASERQGQARNRLAVARQNVIVAQKALDATKQVATKQAEQRIAQATQRVAQAKDRLRQAEQTVEADKVSVDVNRIQRDRLADLLKDGLRSQREFELADQAFVAAEVKLKQSKLAVEIAQKEILNAEADLKFAKATGIQADIDVQRATAQVVSARETLASAQRDVTVFGFEQSRVDADTSATLSRERANLQQVKESLAAISDSIAKAELERENMQARVAQQKIYAPMTGRVSRIGKTVGPGQTVKKDDELLEIVPETQDQAVELVLTGFDAPLVTVGRKARLQFNGFPAVQIQGFPQAAVGTFAGVVTNMDPTDDGSGRVRVWIQPDTEAIAAGKESPWPSSARLRPGIDTIGWVQLDTVPLWYELWRQFNAFPANYTDAAKPSGGKDGKDGKDKKAAKPFKDGDIKVPKR
ncbi:HlyD family secretion protein [Armatimonas rosea]|uniref:Multidrug resistance efflux pump n=1 Tax=Armatimonas rosea TaxID=685828 RepID=A0A7W9W501_ARMRO|nr:HlyD family efflux transporter periplasmic adaptor subunit [Armatimonas rosea]MBB6049083.1 multidrug resistance efflux pump [Armatimonas rosea]